MRKFVLTLSVLIMMVNTAYVSPHESGTDDGVRVGDTRNGWQKFVDRIKYGQDDAEYKRFNPIYAFKKEIKMMGMHRDKVRKKAKRLARRFNGRYAEGEGFKGVYYIFVEWTMPDTKGYLRYHRNYYYFKGGPFLDGYQYVTGEEELYSLILKSCEIAAKGGSQECKRVKPHRYLISRFDIANLYTFHNPIDHVFVSFGAEHDPAGIKPDRFQMSVYRQELM